MEPVEVMPVASPQLGFLNLTLLRSLPYGSDSNRLAAAAAVEIHFRVVNMMFKRMLLCRMLLCHMA
jgi:hypothetical protein